MWKTVSLVLGVLLVAAIFTNGFSGFGTMSAKNAAAKAVTFLNANVLQGQTAVVGEVGDAGTLYSVQLTIGGKTYDAFVTKDGKYFFPSGIDLNEAGGKAAPAAPTAPAPNPNVDMKALADDDPMEGKADAPVTIVEFSDFQCPFCGRFYLDTYTQIKKDYVDTGKVKFIYRDYPLSFHPNAKPAALAAGCANEQGKFWQFHDKLFTNQASLSAENYKLWAKDLGMDTKKFNDCFDKQKYDAEIQKDFADGQAAGVTGTPAFFVNGRFISGAQPYANFKTAIDAALAK